MMPTPTSMCVAWIAGAISPTRRSRDSCVRRRRAGRSRCCRRPAGPSRAARCGPSRSRGRASTRCRVPPRRAPRSRACGAASRRRAARSPARRSCCSRASAAGARPTSLNACSRSMSIRLDHAARLVADDQRHVDRRFLHLRAGHQRCCRTSRISATMFSLITSVSRVRMTCDGEALGRPAVRSRSRSACPSRTCTGSAAGSSRGS